MDFTLSEVRCNRVRKRHKQLAAVGAEELGTVIGQAAPLAKEELGKGRIHASRLPSMHTIANSENSIKAQMGKERRHSVRGEPLSFEGSKVH